jgi:hypothetical protein
MTSTSLLTRSMSRPRSTALGACFGTVDSSTERPRLSGPASPAAALQGTVMVRSVATYPISGASTLASTPFCGQLSSAVVCFTGSSGVAMASAAPSSPATTAIRRAVRWLPAAVTAFDGAIRAS